jgi:hypothetical protein
MNLEKNNLFISYNWGKFKALIYKIANDLEAVYQEKVWIDKNQMIPGVNLHQNIQEGIKNSEMVLAFVTLAYCESNNCKLEIQFANRISKKILYVILEKLENIAELKNGMGVLLSENLCFNAYERPWSDETTTKLKQAIDKTRANESM